jgi:hypothetical protein
MRPVSRQQDEHNKVRNKQCDIEGVGVINTSKRRVEKMLANVLAKASGGSQAGAKSIQDEKGGQTRNPMKGAILPDSFPDHEAA